ncbi:IS3 family transposase [Actinokineospora xionganensis]|uniref:IS3 family transposase n=1 Tax=Actinokineospora xionganensis TaxID=2684470 RepID=UPI001FE2B1DF|nr:IS3 family transposase [Actinokineospora xionganensis]
MPAPKKYPDELRERATRMAVDARKDPDMAAGAIKRVADQLGIHPEALRVWVKRAEIDAGDRPGTTTGDAQRLAELERENRELRRANAILKSASGFLRGGARPPRSVIVAFIDAHNHDFGVEPICAVLTEAGVKIAPSTYYAARSRAPSARAVRDVQVTEKIKEVHTRNYGVYGVRKVHAELARQGGVAARPVARCTVTRLMKSVGLQGISRLKTPRTTRSGKGSDPRPDLVKREFTAAAPNRLWVADITYVRTFTCWAYAAFVLDVFSRRVVGWQVSTSLRTDLALDALEMGLWTRARAGQDTSELIHHSDRGVQYLAVRYTQRLAESGAVASVGSKGDSYDNTLAEAFNSIFKAELIRNKGPWRGVDDVEIAVAEYIDWYNHRRLHGELGLIPPVEYEINHHHTTAPVALTNG